MALNVHTPSVAISASTTTASAALPNSTAKFIRVVNGSTALCYINAGSSSVEATNANPAVRPSGEAIFERIDYTSDPYVAVLLSTGTGTVSVSPCSQPEV